MDGAQRPSGVRHGAGPSPPTQRRPPGGTFPTHGTFDEACAISIAPTPRLTEQPISYPLLWRDRDYRCRHALAIAQADTRRNRTTAFAWFNMGTTACAGLTASVRLRPVPNSESPWRILWYHSSPSRYSPKGVSTSCPGGRNCPDKTSGVAYSGESRQAKGQTNPRGAVPGGPAVDGRYSPASERARPGVSRPASLA